MLTVRNELARRRSGVHAQPTADTRQPAPQLSWSDKGFEAGFQPPSLHSPAVSIALHILPGVVTGVVYLILRQPVAAIGYPSLVALNAAIIVGLLPTAAGILLFSGYRQNGRWSLDGVLLFRERLRLRTYVVYVPLVFGASLVLISVSENFISPLLQATLFGWMPTVDWGLSGSYSKPVLIVSYALVAVASSLSEPVIEELYFRSFVLPRMRYSGRWTVPLHSVLYALFHLWYPWRAVTLAIGITPLVYAVWRSKNIYLGLIVHLLLDSSYLFVGVVYILGMR